MSRAARRLAVPVLLAVLAVTGCADREDDVAGGIGLSADEAAWVGGFTSWSDDLAEAAQEEARVRLAVPATPDRYRAATRWLRECAAHLEEDVGRGPTARTDAIAARLRSLCSSLERTVTRVGDAFASGDDPVGAMVDGGASLERAGGELVEIREALEGFSLARRPLPSLRWPADRSHRDRILEAAAERDIEGFDTEVRCWSDAEWPEMIDEERALSNGEITVDSTGAFANPTTLQINMQQTDCAQLGRAHAESRWWPSSLEERLDLAWALAVLAHEAQHIAGAFDEAETECRGQQRVADVAVALGAPVERARRLAELGWEEQYPELDPEYVSDLCRDVGPYDLRPGTAGRWPWG